jgi:hypothetical protein
MLIRPIEIVLIYAQQWRESLGSPAQVRYKSPQKVDFTQE